MYDYNDFYSYELNTRLFIMQLLARIKSSLFVYCDIR